MPTVTLTPGAVTLTGPAPGLTAHIESTVVGPPPQWADASDATYAHVNNKSHAVESWGGSDLAEAPLPNDGIPLGAALVEVTVSGRFQAPTGARRIAVEVVSASHYGALAYVDLVADGIESASGTVDLTDDTFIGDLPAALNEGAFVRCARSDGFDTEAWIYELSVSVTYGAPVLRVYPRTDGRGLGSARRVWPPSKTAQDQRWHPFGGGYR